MVADVVYVYVYVDGSYARGVFRVKLSNNVKTVLPAGLEYIWVFSFSPFYS